jgi:hypothetical protein
MNNMGKVSAFPVEHEMWMLILPLVILFSCTTQAGQSSRENEFAFSVNIVNNTNFDVSIIDDTRIIPAKSEKIITLPRYMGEIDDGYSLTWRVKLLGAEVPNIYIGIRQKENIIIRSGAASAAIDAPDFFTEETFITLQNRSGETVRLKRDNAYAVRIGQFETDRFETEQSKTERKYGDAGIGPDEEALFAAMPQTSVMAIEADQYRIIHFNTNEKFRAGWLYKWTFDGAAVSLTDARPLVKIGKQDGSKQ